MSERKPMGGDMRGGESGSPFDEETTLDITSRCMGNIGALRALRDLAERGKEVYFKVAPNLGEGETVAEKFQIECGFNLDKLIEKYGK